jgi:hypothetical protein
MITLPSVITTLSIFVPETIHNSQNYCILHVLTWEYHFCAVEIDFLFVEYKITVDIVDDYVQSVLQQASKVMSRGEDHLLNTIQVLDFK